MKPPYKVATIGLAVLLATTAHSVMAEPSRLVPQAGYNYGDIETARSMAMGGAARALGNALTGLYANPANIALTHVYHVGALAQIWPDARRQTYGATIVDSTRPYAAGLGAHYAALDPDGLDRKWTDVRLGLAFSASDKLFIGVAGRYLRLREAGASVRSMPLSAASAGLADAPIVEDISFDAGITLRPVSSLSLGIVGANLTNPGHGLSPTSIGGGAAFGTSDLTLEGNVVADLTTYLRTDGASRATLRYMLGFEYLAADHFPLRIGYRYDEGVRSHSLSAGFGYIDPQFAVELGLRRTVSGPDYATPLTAVVIDVQYFLNSSTTVRGAGGDTE